MAAVILALSVGLVPRESVASSVLGAALFWFWLTTAARVGSRIGCRLNPGKSVACRVLRSALHGYAFVVLSVSLAGALSRIDLVSLTLLFAVAYPLAGPARTLRECRIPLRRIVAGLQANPFAAIVVAAVVGLFAINVGWAGLCPPLHNDDYSYHIAFPVEWGQTGTLGWKYIPFGNNSPPYYPKSAELFVTWFYLPLRGIAHLTLSQALVFPVAGLAVYVLMRDLGADRRAGILGASLCLLTGPIVRYFPSAYVDLTFAVLFVLTVRGLLVFAKDPSGGRWVELCLAAGLFLGTKVLAVAMGVLVVVPVAVLLLWPRRKGLLGGGSAKRIGWAALGVLLLVATGGWWYARNWLWTGNPLFPLIVEVFGVELFDGAYDRSAVPGSKPIQLLAVFVPVWARAGLWHRVAPLLPFAAGMIATLVAAVREKSARLPLLLGVGVPGGIALVFATIVPFGYTRFIFALVLFSAISLVVPFRRGRWAAWAMGGLIAVSLASTATSPDQFSVLLLPLGHQVLEHSSLIWAGLAIGVAFALGGGALALVVLSQRTRAILSVLVGLVGALFLTVLWETSDPTGPHPIEPLRELWAPFAFIEESYGPSRIAFAGSTDSLRYYGWHQRDRARYVNLDEVGEARFHDRVRALSSRREELRGSRLGHGYYRGNPSFEAWIANLEAYGADLLVGRRFPKWVLREEIFFQTKGGFPREVHWAETHPETFARVYDDGSVRIYEISRSEPGR